MGASGGLFLWRDQSRKQDAVVTIARYNLCGITAIPQLFAPDCALVGGLIRGYWLVGKVVLAMTSPKAAHGSWLRAPDVPGQRRSVVWGRTIGQGSSYGHDKFA